jgi:hypothetical protein
MQQSTRKKGNNIKHLLPKLRWSLGELFLDFGAAKKRMNWLACCLQLCDLRHNHITLFTQLCTNGTTQATMSISDSNIRHVRLARSLARTHSLSPYSSPMREVPSQKMILQATQQGNERNLGSQWHGLGVFVPAGTSASGVSVWKTSIDESTIDVCCKTSNLDLSTSRTLKNCGQHIVGAHEARASE